MTDAEKPTEAEVTAAHAAGQSHYSKAMGTHSASGKFLCPYKHPDLIMAWCKGYDAAHARKHA
jgi:hypothetical protein